MRYLVTGSHGFIGSHLVRHLAQGKENIITCVDNLKTGKRKRLIDLEEADRIEFLERDFAHKSILDRVKAGDFDVIVHLAALPSVPYSVTYPLKTLEANLTKATKLIDAVRRAHQKGVKKVRFVNASSSSVYGGFNGVLTEDLPHDPQSPYALQKSAFDKTVTIYSKLYGLDALSLRFFNVFGPDQDFDNAYASVIPSWLYSIGDMSPARLDGDGMQTRDFCYVQNVVDMIELVSTKRKAFVGQAFNVAGGESVPIIDVLNYLTEKYALNVMTCKPRPGDVMHSQADLTRSRSIGYDPKVGLWKGLELTEKAWRLNGFLR